MKFPIILCLLSLLLSGCHSTPSIQLYENSEAGISLDRPENWDVSYYERNGMIVLEAEDGIWSKDSARIEIRGYSCLPAPSWFRGPDVEIKSDIDRIGNLYNLDSVTMVLEPIKVVIDGYEIINAVIAIPTISMLDDPNRIQVRGRGTNDMQTIEIFVISYLDSNFFTIAHVYKGDSEVLNTQAENIIFSIHKNCLIEP